MATPRRPVLPPARVARVQARPGAPSVPSPALPPPPPPAEIVFRPLDPDVLATRIELEPLAPDPRFVELTAEQLVSEVQARRGQATSSFYAMGIVLRELARPARFKQELGFDSFEALLDRRYLINRMTALKLITVATIYDERVARDLGIEKGYALVKYATLTSRAQDAPRLYAKNEVIAGETVRAMSYRDLVRETRRLKAEKSPRPPSEEQTTAERAAKVLQVWLRKSGARGADAWAQRRDGSWSVTVHVSSRAALKCAGAT